MFLRRNPVPFKIMYKNVILKSRFISNNFQVLYQTHQNHCDDDILKISCIFYMYYIHTTVHAKVYSNEMI